MSDIIKARFIAGAVCPRCAAMDTVRLFRRDGKSFRDCVECGFEEQADFDQAPSSASEKELPTRVNAPVLEDEPAVATPKESLDDIQVVKFIDGKKS